MEIISRKDAKAKGLKKYFTGKPCIHGHEDGKYVSTGACVKCVSLRRTPKAERRDRLNYNTSSGPVSIKQRSVRIIRNRFVGPVHQKITKFN